MTPILAMLFACVTPDPPPPIPVTAPAAPAGQRTAKSKSKSKEKSKTKGGGATTAPPGIGVAGPGVLEMTVQSTDTASTATLTVQFSDGSSQTMPLGSMAGKCTEEPPAPVTQGGREVTPLYTFRCDESGTVVMTHVAQVDRQVMVVQIPAATTAGTPKMKVLKRITLVPGVVLSRKG